jgi:hypothetical protein
MLRYDARWALCFHELELAPLWLQERLFKLPRSASQKIILKITSSPNPDSAGTQASPAEDYTASVLYDVVSDLSKNHRVVISPLGVKPFSLLSMLLVTRYKFADVWRVSGAELAIPVSRELMGPLLCYQVIVSD